MVDLPLLMHKVTQSDAIKRIHALEAAVISQSPDPDTFGEYMESLRDLAFGAELADETNEYDALAISRLRGKLGGDAQS